MSLNTPMLAAIVALLADAHTVDALKLTAVVTGDLSGRKFFINRLCVRKTHRDNLLRASSMSRLNENIDPTSQNQKEALRATKAAQKGLFRSRARRDLAVAPEVQKHFDSKGLGRTIKPAEKFTDEAIAARAMLRKSQVSTQPFVQRLGGLLLKKQAQHMKQYEVDVPKVSIDLRLSILPPSPVATPREESSSRAPSPLLSPPASRPPSPVFPGEELNTLSELKSWRNSLVQNQEARSRPNSRAEGESQPQPLIGRKRKSGDAMRSEVGESDTVSTRPGPADQLPALPLKPARNVNLRPRPTRKDAPPTIVAHPQPMKENDGNNLEHPQLQRPRPNPKRTGTALRKLEFIDVATPTGGGEEQAELVTTTWI